MRAYPTDGPHVAPAAAWRAHGTDAHVQHGIIHAAHASLAQSPYRCTVFLRIVRTMSVRARGSCYSQRMPERCAQLTKCDHPECVVGGMTALSGGGRRAGGMVVMVQQLCLLGHLGLQVLPDGRRHLLIVR